DGDPATVDNTVRYADWAMGQFFARARQSAYWHNTLFLVVADLDARVYGASDIPLERFHIPAVIVGADLAPRLDDRLVSQIDLAPTLLSLMGLETFHPMVGVDLQRHSPERAMMQYDNNFGLLSGDQLLVLKPQQPPSQFQLTAKGLSAAAVDDHLARRALAYTLWPVWAYQSERYRVPEPQRYGELLGRD
ncbi:MAG: sulfatase-like hydrolase/transferase, partial [Corallincola sp.]|nr:sulfatase-like hydrolase/transferase [Corallincola sp.]